ncbi:MAG: hypothetical protein ACLUI3_07150 [Christensenellales bacterium]
MKIKLKIKNGAPACCWRANRRRGGGELDERVDRFRDAKTVGSAFLVAQGRSDAITASSETTMAGDGEAIPPPHPARLGIGLMRMMDDGLLDQTRTSAFIGLGGHPRYRCADHLRMLMTTVGAEQNRIPVCQQAQRRGCAG